MKLQLPQLFIVFKSFVSLKETSTWRDVNSKERQLEETSTTQTNVNSKGRLLKGTSTQRNVNSKRRQLLKQTSTQRDVYSKARQLKRTTTQKDDYACRMILFSASCCVKNENVHKFLTDTDNISMTIFQLITMVCFRILLTFSWRKK